MVLQDYGGAAMPATEPVASSSQRFRSVGLVAVAAVAMALLVMAATNGSASTTELVQAKLHQNLMSASADASADAGSGSSDDSQSLSSGSGQGSAGWYGHWSDGGSSSSASAPNWSKQLQKMQARAAARRSREDKQFFSGVDKAFGKKAAVGMLAAFNGKGKNVLTKFKLNEKQLAKQKAKIADNTVVPSHKHAAHHKIIAKHHKSADVTKGDATTKVDAKHEVTTKTAPTDAAKDTTASKKAGAKKAAADKTAAKLAAKKIDHAAEAKKDAAAAEVKSKEAEVKKEALKVAHKMAVHTDPSADKKAAAKPDASLHKADAKKSDDSTKADAKEEASVVKEALKVAHNMDKHVDPVYKKPVVKVAKADATTKAAATVVNKHPTAKNLQHQGLLADAHKMQQLVNEFKDAKGPAKKQLKARVMQLQQDITSDTKAVDHYAHRARTAFTRAEAKKGSTHSAETKKSAHESRHDMSDEQRLKADGWH